MYRTIMNLLADYTDDVNAGNHPHPDKYLQKAFPWRRKKLHDYMKVQHMLWALFGNRAILHPDIASDKRLVSIEEGARENKEEIERLIHAISGVK